MGCGASKIEESVQTTVPIPKAPLPVQEMPKNGSGLSKPVIPSIQKLAKPVAFEIPLDGLRGSNNTISPAPAAKLSLPKLTLSDNEVRAKLADTEARWKVGAQLDHLLYGDLDAAVMDKTRKKPMLRSQRAGETDLAALKKRLHEKEIAAKLNREREIKKLQEKLAKQEEHARQVLERKRALGATSNEELRLSWGGESGFDQHAEIIESSLSGNRSGSGRSNNTTSTDTTDVGDASIPMTKNALKVNANVQQPAARLVE